MQGHLNLHTSLTYLKPRCELSHVNTLSLSLSDCTKWVTQTMHGYFGMAFAMKRDDIKGEMNVWRMNSFRKTTGCNLAHGPGGRLNRVKSPAPIQFLRDY